jgi:hypothetical protein
MSTDLSLRDIVVQSYEAITRAFDVSLATSQLPIIQKQYIMSLIGVSQIGPSRTMFSDFQ